MAALPTGPRGARARRASRAPPQARFGVSGSYASGSGRFLRPPAEAPSARWHPRPWAFSPRFDLPFVLENVGRLPDEDASRHVKLSRTDAEVDGSACAAVDDRLRHVPSREMLRFRERFPHDLDRMRDAPFECEGRVLTNEGERARSRRVGCRHRARFPLTFVP